MHADVEKSVNITVILCQCMEYILSYHHIFKVSPELQVYPVWAAISLLPFVDHRCRNHLGTLSLTRMVENPRFALEISTLSIIVPEI